MPAEPDTESRAIATSIAAVLALLLFAGIYVPHARGYFFLFDDFALLSQASQASLRDILTQPLFGFYRPLAFVFVKGEFLLFGGWSPTAFAASALVLHVLNTTMAGVLAHRLRVSLTFAVATAGMFLLSPWAGEAYFWTSARFDLLATLALLLALWLGDLAATDNALTPASRALRLAGATVAGILALLAKEASVMLPLLFACYAAMRVYASRPGTPARSALRRALAVTLLFALIVAAYLARRQAVLPGLSGAYGTFTSLLDPRTLLQHLGEYSLALVLVPMPADWSWTSLALVFAGKWPFLAVSLPALLLLAIRGARTQAALCVAAFLVSLAPVAWVGMAPMSTASGRLLYMPGLFFALLLGHGVHACFAAAAAAGDRRPAAAWIAAVFVPFVYFAGSLHHQQVMWGTAAGLSRSAVQQFEPLVGTTRPVFLTNLPFWFVEGPFVLKSYAFERYYAPRPVPRVRAAASVLAFGDRGDVREVARIDEPGAPRTTPAPDEVTLTFRLPVQSTGAAAQ